MKIGWTTHSSNEAIRLALRPDHMTMMCKNNKPEKLGRPQGIFFMPYLADLRPFMVIFEWTL